MFITCLFNNKKKSMKSIIFTEIPFSRCFGLFLENVYTKYCVISSKGLRHKHVYLAIECGKILSKLTKDNL